jgi:hypothetical protein
LIPIPSSHDDCDADESDKSMDVLTKIKDTVEINEKPTITQTTDSSAIAKLNEATDPHGDMDDSSNLPASSKIFCMDCNLTSSQEASISSDLERPSKESSNSCEATDHQFAEG